jgi:hypothetical protein
VEQYSVLFPGRNSLVLPVLILGMGSSKLPAGMPLSEWSILMALNTLQAISGESCMKEWKGAVPKPCIMDRHHHPDPFHICG